MKLYALILISGLFVVNAHGFEPAVPGYDILTNFTISCRNIKFDQDLNIPGKLAAIDTALAVATLEVSILNQSALHGLNVHARQTKLEITRAPVTCGRALRFQ